MAASAGLGRVAGQVGRLMAVKVSELLWLRDFSSQPKVGGSVFLLLCTLLLSGQSWG